MSDEFVFDPVQVTVLVDKGDHAETHALSAPACDFCLDSRVRWQYDCGTYVLPEFGFGSEDGWVACDTCADMIEAGDQEGLARRSIRSWTLRGNPPLAVASASIRAIQAGFLKHRQGERRAFG